MAHIGARLTRVAAGEATLELPATGPVTQQNGYVHGGAVSAIADTAGGIAAFTMMPVGANPLTVEYKINLMAPAKGVLLIARGRVIRSGRTLVVAGIDVAFQTEDGQEHVCATALQTLFVQHSN